MSQYFRVSVTDDGRRTLLVVGDKTTVTLTMSKKDTMSLTKFLNTAIELIEDNEETQ
tara:strand:+ start:7279 stop:7449 length:171 start_codon:yes stop_codon:yes gene_type:complete